MSEPDFLIQSRRDLIRNAVKLGIAMGANALLRPIGRLIETGANVGVIEQGSNLHRIAVAEKLLQEVTFDPSEENRDLVFAWLKLNASIDYFKVSNMPLSAKLAEHFLYGQGQSLNITDDYLQCFEDAVEEDSLSFVDSLRALFDPEIDDGHLVLNKESVDSANELLNTGEFFDIGIQGAALPANQDMLYALNKHFLIFRGQGRIYVNQDRYNLEFESGTTIQLIDKYDWSENGVCNSPDSIGLGRRFFDELGRGELYQRIIDFIGEERIEDFNNGYLSFCDKDGALLARRKYGNNFDVTAGYIVTSSFSIMDVDIR